MARRCIKRPVLIAVRIVRFRSSLIRIGRFIVVSATLNEDHREDTKL